MSVLHLPVLVEKLPAREKALFERIYEIDSPPGCLVPEEEMEEWVSRKFGGLEDVKKQRIMRVTNLVTGEGALFNHLRGRRPMDGQGSEDLNSLVREYREGCPFCSPEKFAPRDSFGRIRGKYCITAANLAKYDGYHGLVISNEHHPLKFNSDMVEDYFQVASRWFSEADRHAVKEGDSEPRFPFLMWNCLWPAGSSVVHGHLQLTVTRKRHYPRVEHLRNCGINYARQHGSDYYKDLFAVHRALGLGWTEEDCSLFVSLSPVKEKETWIMMPPGPAGPEKLGRLGRTVSGVLNTLKEKTGLNSFNVAVYLPPLSENTIGWEQFPVIARIVDRGCVYRRTADFGAMELFAASVVSSDPFDTASLLKK